MEGEECGYVWRERRVWDVWRRGVWVCVEGEESVGCVEKRSVGCVEGEESVGCVEEECQGVWREGTWVCGGRGESGVNEEG